jgi:hypothetical protein
VDIRHPAEPQVIARMVEDDELVFALSSAEAAADLLDGRVED